MRMIRSINGLELAFCIQSEAEMDSNLIRTRNVFKLNQKNKWIQTLFFEN